MTSPVFDFRSIARTLNRQEQKADFEEKNPPPPAWYSNAIVWTPEGGYGASPCMEAIRELAEFQVAGK